MKRLYFLMVAVEDIYNRAHRSTNIQQSSNIPLDCCSQLQLLIEFFMLDFMRGE